MHRIIKNLKNFYPILIRATAQIPAINFVMSNVTFCCVKHRQIFIDGAAVVKSNISKMAHMRVLHVCKFVVFEGLRS